MCALHVALVLVATAAAVRVGEPTIWTPHRVAPVSPPRRHVLAAGAAAALVARPPPAHALSDEQRLVGDVWSQVNAQFFDDTFNGLGADGWAAQKTEAITRAGDGPDAAYDAIRRMLGALGDPYTRFLEPEQYEALASAARGGGVGVGVQLQLEPSSGRVVVLQVAAGGPAARGGVRAGDEVVDVDGEGMAGATAELCAAKIRGDAGSRVRLGVRHAAADAAAGQAAENVQTLELERAPVTLNAVEAGSVALGGGRRAGLVRISSFSQETPAQLVDAVRSALATAGGVDALVVDLRGNAGGYMPAGVAAAELFLERGAPIVSEVRRAGAALPSVAQGVGAETKVPLCVLVDGRTASAAEIMAAALQDNGRATLAGPGRTFGKGRIQNVQRLVGGSGVSVTRARYVTPKGRDIHGVGLTPDVVADACAATEPDARCVEAALARMVL